MDEIRDDLRKIEDEEDYTDEEFREIADREFDEAR